jgi:hypothetical protein
MRTRGPIFSRLKRKRELSNEARVLILVALTSISSHAFAQNAQVTFYVHGSRLKTGVPGTNTGIFYGAIYDGTQQLFAFHEVFSTLKNDRFATLNVPPGPHDFAAWYGKHPTSGHHLVVTIEPGKQYFFRAQSESRGVIAVEVEHGRLDQVTCQIAHQEAPSAKPVEIRYPTATFTSMHAPLQSMPPCLDVKPGP